MLHKCNIHCYSMDDDISEMMEVEDDGKWLPFMFSLDLITAIKCSSDDKEDFSYNCSTIFPSIGDVFTVDTPYNMMMSIWSSYYSKKHGYSLSTEEDNAAEL